MGVEELGLGLSAVGLLFLLARPFPRCFGSGEAD